MNATSSHLNLRSDSSLLAAFLSRSLVSVESVSHSRSLTPVVLVPPSVSLVSSIFFSPRLLHRSHLLSILHWLLTHWYFRLCDCVSGVLGCTALAALSSLSPFRERLRTSAISLQLLWRVLSTRQQQYHQHHHHHHCHHHHHHRLLFFPSPRYSSNDATTTYCSLSFSLLQAHLVLLRLPSPIIFS